MPYVLGFLSIIGIFVGIYVFMWLADLLGYVVEKYIYHTSKYYLSGGHISSGLMIIIILAMIVGGTIILGQVYAQ